MDLARGVAVQGQREVVPGDTGTIVAHADQAGTALLHIQVDAA